MYQIYVNLCLIAVALQQQNDYVAEPCDLWLGLTNQVDAVLGQRFGI